MPEDWQFQSSPEAPLSQASHSGDMVKNFVPQYHSEQGQAVPHLSSSESWSWSEGSLFSASEKIYSVDSG